MKIGFDAKRAFLNRTGLGNYSRNTLNALKKNFPEHKYILFTPEIRKDIFPEQESFEIYSPDNPTTRILRSLWRSISLTRILKKQEIDLFHGLSNELPAGIQKSKVRSIVTIHDLIFMRFPGFYKPIDRKIYYQKVKFATEFADKIIAISHQTKNDIVNYLKVNPQKIEVVYQPVSNKFFESANEKLQEQTIKKYGIPDKYILSLGTIESRKNHLNILKAIQQGKVETPLVIVGRSTTHVQKLLDFITEHQMEDKVYFLDQVPDEDLPSLYNKAELLAYISFFEGFGLPIIEAMASGCPVVTSNISCLPEIADDAALFCDPENINDIGEKIMKVLTDSKLKKTLIEKGKERAKTFSPQVAVKTLMEVYQKVMNDAK